MICATCKQEHPHRAGELNCDLVIPGLAYVVLPRDSRAEAMQRLTHEIRQLWCERRRIELAEDQVMQARVHRLAGVPTFAELQERRGAA